MGVTNGLDCTSDVSNVFGNVANVMKFVGAAMGAESTPHRRGQGDMRGTYLTEAARTRAATTEARMFDRRGCYRMGVS